MIYVDYYHPILNVPKKWEGGGHLFGTDLEELHEFAKKLGLRREWYQGKQFPHYDLVRTKRAQAILLGAIDVEPGIIPDGVIRHDPDYR